MGSKRGNAGVGDLRTFEIRQAGYDSRSPLARRHPAGEAPPYSFSRRRRKPSRPWGMKITMAVKMMPTGIR